MIAQAAIQTKETAIRLKENLAKTGQTLYPERGRPGRVWKEIHWAILQKTRARHGRERDCSSVGTSSARWQQLPNVNAQRIREDDQLGIRNATQLRLNFGKCGAAQFKSKNGAARRKKFLRQTLLIPQFSDLRADNVLQPSLVSRHAPEMELDNRIPERLECSNFGADLKQERGEKMRRSNGWVCLIKDLKITIAKFGKATKSGSKSFHPDDVNTGALKSADLNGCSSKDGLSWSMFARPMSARAHQPNFPKNLDATLNTSRKSRLKLR